MEVSEILTEEEIQEALSTARRAKIARIKMQEHWDRVNNPPKQEPLSAEKLYNLILQKAKESIEGFELSDEETAIYKNLSLYFSGDKRFEKNGFSLNKGIILFGKVGCGKTTVLNLFQCNPFQSYAVIPCRTVGYTFSKQGYDAIEKYFDLLPSGRPDLTYGQRELGICFDDLGTENIAKNFGNEANVMAEIILNRYDSERGKVKTHITTNLTAEEIETTYGSRVKSRMREMFNAIQFPNNITDKRK